MKRSGDLVIERDRMIEKLNLTTEAQRHGGNREIGPLSALHIRMLNAFSTLHAMIREIFDESAYDRFLRRTNAQRSVASYRDFTRERDATMLKKPRCC